MQYMSREYTSGSRGGGMLASPFLPSIGNSQHTFSYDKMPAPSPLKRSYTTLGYRPGMNYQSASINPSQSYNSSQFLNTYPKTDSSVISSVARDARNTRFSSNDWEAKNQRQHELANRIRATGERLRNFNERVVLEANDKTKRCQNEANKLLGERVSDLEFWKIELDREKDAQIKESDLLVTARQQLEQALGETENPLRMASECLLNREKRLGIDLVHDNVEASLIKEVETIRRGQERMRKLLDKTDTQVSLNRASLHELERDTEDKMRAKQLDVQSSQLNNASRGISFYNGLEHVDNSQSVPVTWAKYSHSNIQRSQSERAMSYNNRVEIDAALAQTYEEIKAAYNRVNAALEKRLQDETEARNNLNAQLGKVLQEIDGMDKNIELIKKTIQEKVAPMQVAQTRLDIRNRRPNVELCRDMADLRLKEEVHQINDTVSNLQRQLQEAEDVLQQLLTVKTSLDEDLKIKNNSIAIDKNKCAEMRTTFPLPTRRLNL